MRLREDERAPGRWDYDGKQAPTPCLGEWRYPRGVSSAQETFSLGCFRWTTSASGKGLVREPVAHRIKGRLNDPSPAFRQADAWCAMREAKEAQGGAA